jgi:predicted nucleic acid-binding protein
VIVLNSESINYLFDSFAWIEYFLGSQKGLKVKKILESENILTSIISVAELSDKYYREGLINEWEVRYHFIINKSTILPISLEIAKNAGLRKLELRKVAKSVGIADSLLYETAINHNLTIVTGDQHFINLENVFFLS